MSCNCTAPCTSTCPSYCGCTVQVPGTCVFYRGSNLTCIDATQGDTYDSILANINDIVCDLLPPSGLPDYVGVAGEIVITGNVIGLAPAITGAISTAQTNIAALQACALTTVKNITSASPNLVISTTSTGTCGRSLSINFVPPVVPDSEKQGIIDNKTGSTNVPNNYTITYDLSTYALGTGDVIKFKGNLRRAIASSSNNEQTYLITDGISTDTLTSNGRSGLYPTADVCIDDFEIILSVVSNTAGTLTVKTYGVFDTLVGKLPNITTFRQIPAIPLKRIFQFPSTLALDETNVRLVFQQTDTPVMEQYFVEIIRKI